MSAAEDRREAPRLSRRLQVRFWTRGDTAATSGMTANLSASGALVTAPKVHPRGTRLRLELQLEDGKVVVEGEVAHGHRIPVELRALGASAMGVRFLPPEELLAPLLGAGSRAGGPSGGEPSAGGVRSRTRAGSEPPAATVSSPTGPGTSAAAPGAEPRVYAVRFAGVEEFLDCYRRDLCNGGLFVRTHNPRELQQVVYLRFHLPAEEGVLRGRGRVVQRVPPPSEGTAGGMGLELIELGRLLDQLRPVVERLEGC